MDLTTARSTISDASTNTDDVRPVGGISVIPIPKHEIARLHGILRLSELPRHKPTIVSKTWDQ